MYSKNTLALFAVDDTILHSPSRIIISPSENELLAHSKQLFHSATYSWQVDEFHFYLFISPELEWAPNIHKYLS